jgi:hypothetical protein
MQRRLSIHPLVGVARLGNSGEFYLAPETIGGRPIECDTSGVERMESGVALPVERYKDAAGRVKRQAARFRIMEQADDDSWREVTTHDGVRSVEWCVHIANKKAAWYQFSELEGNLLYKDNSYTERDVPFRNAGVTDLEQRRALIIDPGPRSLSGPSQRAEFSKATIPPGYRHGSFPATPTQGEPITTLGEMLTDADGRLLVLGGYGRTGGDQPISSFAGADTWHDDIADGSVTARVTLDRGETIELQAWVIVGSPKFAPELVNIVTLDDVMYDVAVRYFGLMPELYTDTKFNSAYIANFERDILPIMRRPLDYIWVANVPQMVAFGAPTFDVRDASPQNAATRKELFRYFRRPAGDSERLLAADGIPLMPLNSGSNSVSNRWPFQKFLGLTETQFFLLSQWAEGNFTNDAPAPSPIQPLTHASVGNCVGAPMCPGIEVTWSLWNPNIYAAPYQIRVRNADYAEAGLSTRRDECVSTDGCEPGDLTKRMAIPWQADFFQCTAQYINYTLPARNKENGIPVPPTYYAYWWPPQSPMFVISGDDTIELQAASGAQAGFQLYFSRGINSFSQMIQAWSYLGFIVNQNDGHMREVYPYFIERERNHDRFIPASVAVGDASVAVTGDDSVFTPMWFLKPETKENTHEKAIKAQALMLANAPAGMRARIQQEVFEQPSPVRAPSTGPVRHSRDAPPDPGPDEE